MSNTGESPRGFGAMARSALLATAVATTLGIGAAQAADKPNIVVLMTDDTGWAD